MDLLKTTKDLLKQNHLVPDNAKSQNFLINEKVYDAIVESASINKYDVVLEIGPGLGFLTTRLLAKAESVVAVEVDDRLVFLLNKLTKQYDNLKIINKNVLGFDESELVDSYKLVANLPYHLTGKILKKFLSSEYPPQSLVVLVQKEVADRICAGPGKHSLLSLSIQYYGRSEKVSDVSADSFFPVPKVDSAILRVSDIKPASDKQAEKRFWQTVKIGFSGKRKTLVHNLSSGFQKDKKEFRGVLQKIGLSEKIRAQELSIDDWEKLILELVQKGYYKKL